MSVLVSPNEDPKEMSKFIEANRIAFWKALGKSPVMDVIQEQDILFTSSDVKFPFFNSILQAKFSADHQDRRTDQVLSNYKYRDVPIWWWVAPSTTPADLGLCLERHGLVHEETQVGMAANLDTIKESSSESIELTLKSVASEKDLNAFASTCIAGFESCEFCADPLKQALLPNTICDSPTFFHYVGWVESEPISTSSLFLAEGVAGIFFVSVRKSHRGKGIGRAMTLAALSEAQKKGYRVAVLFATEIGYQIYRNMGFEEYCTMKLYDLPYSVK
ncbi:MAG: hypothetical protein NPIRA01_04020 [Nitrospirales bacterium]|nr:MAG: hypothetical protein NPIRA01_04020 [Nitrospirales bacterium]